MNQLNRELLKFIRICITSSLLVFVIKVFFINSFLTFWNLPHLPQYDFSSVCVCIRVTEASFSFVLLYFTLLNCWISSLVVCCTHFDPFLFMFVNYKYKFQVKKNSMCRFGYDVLSLHKTLFNACISHTMCSKFISKCICKIRVIRQ